MLHKCARIILASVLALSLCPALAFADEGPGSTGDPLKDLLYMVVGFGAGDDGRADLQSASPLYDSQNTLAVPQATKTLPGLSAADDLVSGGVLVAAYNRLFYFRQASFDNGSGGKVRAFHTMEVYDIASNSWVDTVELPGWYEFLSACISAESSMTSGSIMICATPMNFDGTTPSYSTSLSSVMLSYDPSADIGSFAPDYLATEGVLPGAAIVDNGGMIQLAGGLSGSSASSQVAAYSPSSGVTTVDGDLGGAVVGGQAVPHNGSLYVYGAYSSLSAARAGTASVGLYNYSGGSGYSMAGGLPAVEAPANVSDYPCEASVMSGSIASADGLDSGIYYVGPTAQGDGTDTFVLDWGAQAFSPFGQCLDTSQLSGAADTVYCDKLYGLASVRNADGTASMVFRSTPVNDGALLTPPTSPWRKGSRESLEIAFTPDYSRFSHRVTVDGQELIGGVDYDSTQGTTRIDLLPEYLEKLDYGPHQLIAYFDDENTAIPATFTIEQSADQIPGYTRPAALARTADPLDAAPAVAVAFAAMVVVLFAYRRSKVRS